MWDLPGELGLTVIDDLSEMIGVEGGKELFDFFESPLKFFPIVCSFFSAQKFFDYSNSSNAIVRIDSINCEGAKWICFMYFSIY